MSVTSAGSQVTIVHRFPVELVLLPYSRLVLLKGGIRVASQKFTCNLKCKRAFWAVNEIAGGLKSKAVYRN